MDLFGELESRVVCGDGAMGRCFSTSIPIERFQNSINAARK